MPLTLICHKLEQKPHIGLCQTVPLYAALSPRQNVIGCESR
jgi:hypothetical protein